MPQAWLKPLPNDILNAKFVNGQKIFDALTTDYPLSKLLPDSYSGGYREYVLNIVNSYTGSELEQCLKRANIDILEFQ